MASEGENFGLRGGAGVPARLTDFYRHPYRHYAPLYGYSDVKTIKRFVRAGKEAQPEVDLPPLDDATMMPAWWRRHFPRCEVPRGIRHAADKARAEASTSNIAPSGTDQASGAVSLRSAQHPTSNIQGAGDGAAGIAGAAGGGRGDGLSLPGVPAPMAAAPSEGGKGLDFPGTVAELRKVTTAHLEELRRVSGEQEPGGLPGEIERAEWARAKGERVEAAQRTFKSSVDILRKAENDLVEWEKSHEDLVRKAEVGPEIARVVGAIHSGVKRLLRTVRPRLEGKSDAEQDRLFAEGVREVFRVLIGSKFSAVSFPDVPAPSAAAPDLELVHT